jgi:hypothetical protein
MGGTHAGGSGWYTPGGHAWYSIPRSMTYGYKWLQTHSRFTIFCYELAAMFYSKIVGWV